jgi:putative Mg2+ transporter-C (MgtC) family protein
VRDATESPEIDSVSSSYVHPPFATRARGWADGAPGTLVSGDRDLRGPMIGAFAFGEPTGQGWTQVFEIALALVLSSLVGLERERAQKSAGLRTHALVGVGAALFVLVSKYGFTDVLAPGKVVLDPSRVAAQIVTGIGFIGGGLIFVRGDLVRGLTTAAVVWVTAAVGAACGAGLPILAAIGAGCHFLVVQASPVVTRRFGVGRYALSTVEVRYADGRGLLRAILALVTARGFVVHKIAASNDVGGGGGAVGASDEVGRGHEEHGRVVGVTLRLQGAPTISELASALSEIDGVVSVVAGSVEDPSE